MTEIIPGEKSETKKPIRTKKWIVKNSGHKNNMPEYIAYLETKNKNEIMKIIWLT